MAHHLYLYVCCGYDGIGRRAGFRFLCRKALGFKSPCPHHFIEKAGKDMRTDQWMNCDAGSSQAVYAKCLNRSFQDLRERIVQETEITKTKVRKVDYSMDR